MRCTLTFWGLLGCGGVQKGTTAADTGAVPTTEAPAAVDVFDGFGTFQLELAPPRGDRPGEAAILGSVLDGPTPDTLVWEVASSDGACALYTPRVPFCDPRCDGSEACVEDNVCEPYPSAVEVGTVTVAGVETTTGATTFTMEPIAGYYQLAADTDLAYPPFEEGAEVTFSASGTASAAPFTLTASGIAPLEVADDTLTLVDGEPVTLHWTPPSQPDRSRVHITVNVSYHAGTKGIISCDVPDTGTLELSGALLDDLKSLGLSGWPIIVFSRSSHSFAEPDVSVDLLIESSVTRDVEIPGLISCNSDADCPDGQTCQFDFQCG